MADHEYLAERFEEHRTHLRAVAYRMLGSLSEVDDAVQEAWVRLSRADATAIDNLGGWLTTVVARVCLDMLRSRQSRREQPFAPGAPEPAATGTRGSSSVLSERSESKDPEQEMLLADSVGLALLVVLDRLSPAERLAFVLHDMFAVPFEEIAPIVGRSTEATRQLASRARRRVRGGAALWAKGAVAYGHMARLVRPALVNDAIGLVMASRGRLFRALTFKIVGGKIAEIEVIGDPSRLGELDVLIVD
jgi:RNA polymerase sigma-70 factor (ECF subfamily)